MKSFLKCAIVDKNLNYVSEIKNILLQIFSDKISIKEISDIYDLNHSMLNDTYDVIFMIVDNDNLQLDIVKNITRTYRYTNVVSILEHKNINTITLLFQAGSKNCILKKNISANKIKNIICDFYKFN